MSELGVTTEREYSKLMLKKANEINYFNVSFVDKKGDTHKYNTVTKEYIVITENGTVKTIFIPEKPDKYYNEQKEKYAKSKT